MEPYVSEQKRLISAAEIDAQRMPTREQTEASYREKVTKDLPYDVADQLKSLTTEGQEAIKQRDSDRWLAVAMGGFAAAAGQSPRALQNFAEGLGLTAKEFRVINKDFKAAETERRKMQIALQQQARAEELGLREKAVAAGDRADTARRAAQDRVDSMQTNLLGSQMGLVVTGAQMEQQKRLTLAKIAAQQEATGEVRRAREEGRESARLNNLAVRYGAEIDRLAKLILAGMGPTALTDPTAAAKAEAQARRTVLNRNPQYKEIAGEDAESSTPGAGAAVKRYNLATGKLE